jgi:hypothetical protein
MVTKNQFSAAEPRFMCNVCSETITTPLCPFCLTTEIEAWLTLYPDLRNQLLPKLKKYLYAMETRLMEGINCFKCNKRASVCPFCFTEYILNELRKIGATNIILKEFFEFFDFDFSRIDYRNKTETIHIY